MKKMLSLGLLVLSLIFAYACEGLLPTDATKRDCEKNGTGTLSVTNNSKRSLDYAIVVDGINYGRVAVGAKKEITLSAGVHMLEIRYADHAGDACSVSFPTIIQCQNTGLSCDG